MRSRGKPFAASVESDYAGTKRVVAVGGVTRLLSGVPRTRRTFGLNGTQKRLDEGRTWAGSYGYLVCFVALLRAVARMDPRVLC